MCESNPNTTKNLEEPAKAIEIATEALKRIDRIESELESNFYLQEKENDRVYWQGFSLGFAVASVIVAITVLAMRLLK